MNDKEKDTKFICPDCGKNLELMSYYREGDYIVGLFNCEECKDGIDSDWVITYTKENGIEKIERYYFG